MEIWAMIFERLDETSQAICMHVCREWHGLVLSATREEMPIMYATALARSVALVKWQAEYPALQRVDERTCAHAAANGCLEVLKFLHTDGVQPWDWTTCRSNAAEGHLPLYVLELDYKNRCRWERRPFTCTIAAKGGHFAVLQYLHESGCPWDMFTCRAAVEGGHLQILQYAIENGCPWDDSACERAALGGHLAVLQYAHENGCPWDSKTTRFAAEKGYLAVLQYAHENGCPWDELTCTRAAYEGHLDVLKYAHENGCPWPG